MFNTLFINRAGAAHPYSIRRRARHANQFVSTGRRRRQRQLSDHAVPVGGRAGRPWPPQGPPANDHLPQGGAAADADDDGRHRRLDGARDASDGRHRTRTLRAARHRDLRQLGGGFVHQGPVLPPSATAFVQERQLAA